MNDTIPLLQSIARAARAGESATGILVDRAETPAMREALQVARARYREIAHDAEAMLSAAGSAPEPVQRAGVWLDEPPGATVDRSDAHIAERVIRGATLGVIEVTRVRGGCPDADDAAAALASRFIVDQDDLINGQKAFLREPALV